MKISNQTVLITGAAQGLGLAIAKAFAKEKAKLILIDKKPDELDKIKFDNCQKYVVDLNIREETKRVINELKKNSFVINTLIHNASILVPTPFIHTTEKIWDQTMKVTLESGFLLSKYVWEDMSSNKDGVIIFVSSGSGLKGFEDETAYCAAKHGLEGLMKSLAIEGMKNKIQVFTITPGMYMNTPMSESNYTEEFKKKWVDPIELTPAFLKLSSRRYQQMSGQHVNAWNFSKTTDTNT